MLLIIKYIDWLKYTNKFPKSAYKFSDNNQTVGQLDVSNLIIALMAGYVSILITNFFGFSTVPTSFLFFILPAMAISLRKSEVGKVIGYQALNAVEKILIFFILLTTSYLLLTTLSLLECGLHVR